MYVHRNSRKLKLIPPSTLTTPCVRCRAPGSGVDPMVSIPCRQSATSHTLSSKMKSSHYIYIYIYIYIPYCRLGRHFMVKKCWLGRHLYKVKNRWLGRHLIQIYTNTFEIDYIRSSSWLKHQKYFDNLAKTSTCITHGSSYKQ